MADEISAQLPESPDFYPLAIINNLLSLHFSKAATSSLLLLLLHLPSLTAETNLSRYHDSELHGSNES